jgi:hypothetical protein
MFRSAPSALALRRYCRLAGASRTLRSTFRPRLEALEDRRVPAHWAVTSPADNINQPGTLRWAVAQAQNGDTIEVRTNQTIFLTQGELVLANDLTIVHMVTRPVTRTKISGDHLSRVFEVSPAAHVKLFDVDSFDGNGVANNPTARRATTLSAAPSSASERSR